MNFKCLTFWHILALYNGVSCQVRSPYGNDFHYGDSVHSGNFAFTAAEAGDYTACFSVPSNLNLAVTVLVDFVWKNGFAAKDWSKVVKKGHIEVSLWSIIMFLHIEFIYVWLVLLEEHFGVLAIHHNEFFVTLWLIKLNYVYLAFLYLVCNAAIISFYQECIYKELLHLGLKKRRGVTMNY